MRMAGQAWFPPANQMGQGCATKPETYPAPVKPTMSHGDPRKEEWGTKSGKNSTQGKKATGERYLPKKARAALSDEEYARSTARKRASIRKGEQHSKQPDDIAKKTARHRS